MYTMAANYLDGLPCILSNLNGKLLVPYFMNMYTCVSTFQVFIDIVNRQWLGLESTLSQLFLYLHPIPPTPTCYSRGILFTLGFNHV